MYALALLVDWANWPLCRHCNVRTRLQIVLDVQGCSLPKDHAFSGTRSGEVTRRRPREVSIKVSGLTLRARSMSLKVPEITCCSEIRLRTIDLGISLSRLSCIFHFHRCHGKLSGASDQGFSPLRFNFFCKTNSRDSIHNSWPAKYIKISLLPPFYFSFFHSPLCIHYTYHLLWSLWP